MKLNALDEIEGRLDVALERLAEANDGKDPMGNLSFAIAHLLVCVRNLRDAMRDGGTLHKIAERLETMEG
jgi:hypothetical protein